MALGGSDRLMTKEQKKRAAEISDYLAKVEAEEKPFRNEAKKNAFWGSYTRSTATNETDLQGHRNRAFGHAMTGVRDRAQEKLGKDPSPELETGEFHTTGGTVRIPQYEEGEFMTSAGTVRIKK